MVERHVTIQNRNGLHARPAAQLVHLASSFSCDVSLQVSGNLVDAKSILGILQLGAAQGTDLLVVCEGADEQPAAVAITELITNGFGEES